MSCSSLQYRDSNVVREQCSANVFASLTFVDCPMIVKMDSINCLFIVVRIIRINKS